MRQGALRVAGGVAAVEERRAAVDAVHVQLVRPPRPAAAAQHTLQLRFCLPPFLQNDSSSNAYAAYVSGCCMVSRVNAIFM